MLVDIYPNNRPIFTPGPGALLAENLEMMDAYFGRGDVLYDHLENSVLEYLKKFSSKKNIVRMQGSATLALEISITNFVQGSVIVVDTGFYSDRLYDLILRSKFNSKHIGTVDLISYDQLITGEYKSDWIVLCYVETSKAIKLNIKKIHEYSKNIGAKILCDATASIGLEEYHDCCDIAAFSSCKGLFGLTGASFIAYNDLVSNKVDSFYLDIKTHEQKMVTGPYHTIASLHNVLLNHESIKQSVIINKREALKKFGNYITVDSQMQPLLCTKVNANLTAKSTSTLLYKPRSIIEGSIICHLGELHLGSDSNGDILNSLEII